MNDIAVPNESLPMAEARNSFASLFAWIETFHTLDNSLKYEDLLEQVFIFEVLQQIDSRPLWTEPINCAKDPASQIHNSSILFIQLISCYMDCLHQAVVMPMLDVTALINYKSDLSTSQQEMQKILLLVLGLAIQSDRKDDFISVMETLPSSVKEDIMMSYKELTGHLVRLDTRDDSIALRQCCEDRLTYFKKYSHAVQEKHYLETVLLSAQSCAGPDLLRSLRPPEGLVDFHGYQLLLGSANQQAASLTAQLEDRAVEAAQLTVALQQKREKAKRLKAQLKSLSVSDHAVRLKSVLDENERLKETIKTFQEMNNEVANLRQRLAEFDFYKARVQELRDENGQLLEERQRADERLAAARAHSDATVERLAECQLRCDDLAVQRDTEAEQAAASAVRLTAENRRLREALVDALGGADAAAAASAASASAAAAAAASKAASAPSLAAELATAKRIRDLESQAKRLTAAEADWQRRACDLERQLRRLTAEKAEAQVKAAADVSAARRAADDSKLTLRADAEAAAASRRSAAESENRAVELERQVLDLLAERAKAITMVEAAAESDRDAAESKQRIMELERCVQTLLAERERAKAVNMAEVASAASGQGAAEREQQMMEFERRVQQLLAERTEAEAAARAEIASARRAATESAERAADFERRLRQALTERAEASRLAASESEQRSAELEQRLLAGQETVASATAAAAEAETELVLQTSQELARHLARLGSNNRALRQSCDKLKAELNRLSNIEHEVTQLREARAADARELQRLEAQNRQLRRTTASVKASPPAPASATSKAAAAAQPERSRSSATASGKRPIVDRSH